MVASLIPIAKDVRGVKGIVKLGGLMVVHEDQPFPSEAAGSPINSVDSFDASNETASCVLVLWPLFPWLLVP
jgi:hypothetical protein